MDRDDTIPSPKVWRFNGHTPEVDHRAYVHPSATLIGNVRIGARCYIGPGVVLRGDNGPIHILEGSNLQDGVIVHGAPGSITLIEQHCHIAHGVVLHGCRVGVHAFVGINSVVMDRATIGPDAWVAAMSYVREGFEVPARMLAIGSPARIAKELKPEQIAAKRRSTQGYVDLAAIAHQSVLVEPQRPAVSESAPDVMSAAHRAARWLARVGRRAASPAESLTS